MHSNIHKIPPFMLYFQSSLAPQHRALTTFFFVCQFQHLTVGVSAHWNSVEKHSLLTEKRNPLEEKKKRQEKQNGMQFSRVYPPYVSSTVFLAGRVIRRKALAHNTPSTWTQREHLSLEFGLESIIGGLHITKGKMSVRPSIGLYCWCKLYRLKCLG